MPDDNENVPAAERRQRAIASKYGAQVYMLCEGRAYKAAEDFATQVRSKGLGVPSELTKLLGEAFNTVMMDAIINCIALFGEDKVDRKFFDSIDY